MQLIYLRTYLSMRILAKKKKGMHHQKDFSIRRDAPKIKSGGVRYLEYLTSARTRNTHLDDSSALSSPVQSNKYDLFYGSESVKALSYDTLSVF